MSLVDIAKEDAELFNTDPQDWAVTQEWISPTGQTVNIFGRHVKHHTAIDDQGLRVNSKNASVTFSEQSMIDVNYTIRNTEGEVDMNEHRVNVKDSTGIVYKYKVKEFYPDETLGMIVCILNAYESN